MKRNYEDSDSSESHRRNSGYSQSRILDIERAERAAFLGLLQRAEKLYNSQNARVDEMMKRMGFSIQQDTLPHLSLQFLQQETLNPLCGGRRLRPEPRDISNLSLITPTPPPPARATRRPSRLPVITMKFGGAAKEVTDGCKLQSSQATLDRFVETIEKLEFCHRPSPEPPTAPSRIPMLASRFASRPSEANRKIPHRGTLAVARKVPAPPSEAAPAHRKGPRRGFLAVAPKSPAPPSEAAPPNRSGLHHETSAVAPRVPAPPSEPAPAHRKGPRRGTLVVAPKVPAPPSEAAPPSRKGPRRGTLAVARESPAPPSEAAPPSRKGPRSGTLAVAPKSPAPPSEAAPSSRKGPRSGTKCPPIEDLRPLVDPEKSLSLCSTQLTSDNWEENMKGLKSVRALARHHPEHLQTKLHEVCLVVTEAVNNLRSAVAGSAMSTLAELHTQLGRAMDTEAQWTGRVLLLKLAKTTNAFMHQQANFALDALVEGCSTIKVLSVLLNTGLSHRCAAVRGCTAQHLHQLADILGEEQILTAGKPFTQSFLIAVSKMAVDASPDVRYYGQMMLKGLAHQKRFAALWDRTIPEEDRRPLDKILKKMGQ